MIEAQVAEDFHFTSPLDNAINRSTSFAICWPNSERSAGIDFIAGFETEDTAFITSKAFPRDGKRSATPNITGYATAG